MTQLTVDDYINFPVVKPDVSYNYGQDQQQYGELFLPTSGNQHPVIVLVHGGCYREMYSVKPLGQVARALAEEGFAVWAIEYRRAGNGGDYPTMFLDVAIATDFLREKADVHALNLDHVLTVGHSAGGHLALWLAGRHQLAETSPLYIQNPLAIHAVVALAPIADLIYGFEQGQCGDALTQVMGGTPQTTRQHYIDGSPRELLPLGVPQTHIIGTADTEMLDNTRPYIEAAQSAGDSAKLITVADVGHFEIVDSTSDVWYIVRDAIVAYK
jgi:acetyl esterase/lipase